MNLNYHLNLRSFNNMTLIYDGSLEGLFSVFYHIYAQSIKRPIIVKDSAFQPGLFEEVDHVPTNNYHAERVIKSLRKKTGRQFYQFLYAAHNDRDGIENKLFDYAKYIWSSSVRLSIDYANPAVLKIAQYAKSVDREKHRMEAFVRFRLTKDNIYFSSIAPDFNVIPLIKKHFKERYGDQQWLIYDLKRNYGIYYNLNAVERVELTFKAGARGILNTSTDIFKEEEQEFQLLWANYFKSTNIESRKNMKLHLQHVPKRYWKYLSEKRL